MAFYQFLAIFPSLLIAYTLVTHIPHLADHLRKSLGDLSGQLFPNHVLLLWLYASNGALLIGGEMNSEIQKAETGRSGLPPETSLDTESSR